MHVLSDAAPVQDGKWSDLGIRFLSAAILGPIALFCVWHGGWAWRIFIVVAAAGLADEWAALSGMRPRGWAERILELSLFAGAFFMLNPGTLVTAGIFALGAALILPLAGWFAAAGLPYAGIGAISLIWLRLQPYHGLTDTLFLVVVVWSTDIGAYLVGRVFGGSKMAPRISPGKTWSGAAGGLASGALAGALLAGQFHTLSIGALPAGLLLSISAQAGDLLESAIKRKLGVKDSGKTIPGHGGLFDRLDGFLVAAPVAALLALGAHGGLPLWA